VLNLIRREIDSVLSAGITEAEFHMGREQLKGNYILGMESTSSRMTALGKAELLLGRAIPPAEILSMMDATTPEMVQRVIEKVFQPDTIAAALVGPEDITKAVKTQFKRR
jgi:predicted Zn-dependent peptidase